MAEFGLNMQTEELMRKDSRIWVAGHKGLVGSADRGPVKSATNI